MLVPSRSDGIWGRLARMPRAQVFVAALVLVLAGLFLPGAVGGVLLLVLAVGMAAILRNTWPVTSASRRSARVVVLVSLATVALLKIFWGAW